MISTAAMHLSDKVTDKIPTKIISRRVLLCWFDGYESLVFVRLRLSITVVGGQNVIQFGLALLSFMKLLNFYPQINNRRLIHPLEFISILEIWYRQRQPRWTAVVSFIFYFTAQWATPHDSTLTHNKQRNFICSSFRCCYSCLTVIFSLKSIDRCWRVLFRVDVNRMPGNWPYFRCCNYMHVMCIIRIMKS